MKRKIKKSISVGIVLAVLLTSYVLTAGVISTIVTSQAESSSGAEILLTPDNTVTFRTAVDEASVLKKQLELLALVVKRGTQNYPIYLVMDCPGGSVADGLMFIDLAKTYPNIKTVTLFAASMCSAIIQHLPGERLGTTSGIQMFHRAKGRFEGHFEDGEVESQLALWKSIINSMEQVNANRLRMTLEAYKAKAVHEWWVYGNDLLKTNMVDRMVSLKCSPELIDQSETEITASFFGSSTKTYSGCPLLRSPKE